MAVSSNNLKSASFMMLSMAGFVFNDTLMKWASADYQLFQAIFLRGCFATLMVGAILLWRGQFERHYLSAAFLKGDGKVIAWRTLGEVGSTFCFLSALFNMPIANATSILQVMPLGVTLAASVFFGEKVGWRRYSAIAVGFFGVLLVVKPGTEGFNAFSFYALAAVGFAVLRDLSTRRLTAAVPSFFVSFCSAVAVTVMAAIGGLSEEWQQPSPADLGLFATAACFLICGYLFGIMTMRIGEIAFTSPFRYSVLLWAMLLGYLVFGEVPDSLSLIGSAVIVGSGLYTFYREQVVRAKPSPPPRGIA